MKNTIDLTIKSTFSLDELADEIASADISHEQIVELIKAIDLIVADWDFTLLLCDYFNKQRKLFEAEEERQDNIEAILMP